MGAILPVPQTGCGPYRPSLKDEGLVALRRIDLLSIEEAMRPATVAEICARRKALAANGHGVRAAWVETAATWRVDEAGNLATGGDIGNALTVIRVIHVDASRVWRG
jgi:hypothetical protein